jgi:putative transposase
MSRRGEAATPYLFMNIGRKSLPHSGAPGDPLNSEYEVYFITICCKPRTINQLAHAEVWDALLETMHRREEAGSLRIKVALAMPDHFHGMLGFPGTDPMTSVIGSIKSWMAKQHRISWQRDFFDHRLRSWESAVEKTQYVLMNPVRVGLVNEAEDWPFRYQNW